MWLFFMPRHDSYIFYQSSKPMAHKGTIYDGDTIPLKYSSKERLEVEQKGRLDTDLFG